MSFREAFWFWVARPLAEGFFALAVAVVLIALAGLSLLIQRARRR
jgi:hypothetical protein